MIREEQWGAPVEAAPQISPVPEGEALASHLHDPSLTSSPTAPVGFVPVRLLELAIPLAIPAAPPSRLLALDLDAVRGALRAAREVMLSVDETRAVEAMRAVNAQRRAEIKLHIQEFRSNRHNRRVRAAQNRRAR